MASLTKAPLDPLAAFWHLVNFFAPAVGLGFIAAALAKLVWRARTARMPWWRLGAVGSGFAALALVGGLVVFARDGRIATYGAMVLATALSLWWFGLRR